MLLLTILQCVDCWTIIVANFSDLLILSRSVIDFKVGGIYRAVRKHLVRFNVVWNSPGQSDLMLFGTAMSDGPIIDF